MTRSCQSPNSSKRAATPSEANPACSPRALRHDRFIPRRCKASKHVVCSGRYNAATVQYRATPGAIRRRFVAC